MYKHQEHTPHRLTTGTAITALLLSLPVCLTLWRLSSTAETEHLDIEPSAVIISRDRFGQTKRLELVAVIKTALVGRSAFIGANVDRTYTDVEHLRRTVLGMPSDATITFRYGVAYPIGFDLRTGQVGAPLAASVFDHEERQSHVAITSKLLRPGRWILTASFTPLYATREAPASRLCGRTLCSRLCKVRCTD
jgi:hypothetical protein